MFRAMGEYFNKLTTGIGQGWNKFWYTPQDACMLGFIRVLTGVVLLYVHVAYCFDLERLYGPQALVQVSTVETLQQQGVASEREMAKESIRELFSFSYLRLARNNTDLWVLHAIGFVVLLLFTAGYNSRISAVLALIVTLSYRHRAPMLTFEFEPILTFVQLYLCLGPCGAAFSLDRWLAERKSSTPLLPPVSYDAGIVIRLMQVHVSLVFLMMALGKLAGPNPPAVWWTGEAVWWLLASVDTRPFDFTGLAMGTESSKLVDIWTHAIVWFELGFGFLVWNRLARPLMLFLMVILWIPLVSLATGLFLFTAMLAFASLSFISGSTLRSSLGTCGQCV